MVRRGDSRDHRPDCEQLVIALIVNSEGFPFSYETFDGNRADVSTMETILRMVERKYGKARRVWVFDRGIVSEENLAAIRKRDGQYLVGAPRSRMKQFEAELLQQDWTRVRPEVEVKKVAIPGCEETYVLCRTAGRKEKEKAIPQPLFQQHGKGSEGFGEDDRYGPSEGPQQDGAPAGKNTGAASSGKRSLRRCSARFSRGRASGLADERRP